MQLVEQGKLDLDADVNTYLENFKIRETFDEPITLRHILTHTAGFEDGALGYLIIDDPGRSSRSRTRWSATSRRGSIRPARRPRIRTMRLPWRD